MESLTQLFDAVIKNIETVSDMSQEDKDALGQIFAGIAMLHISLSQRRRQSIQKLEQEKLALEQEKTKLATENIHLKDKNKLLKVKLQQKMESAKNAPTSATRKPSAADPAAQSVDSQPQESEAEPPTVYKISRTKFHNSTIAVITNFRHRGLELSLKAYFKEVYIFRDDKRNIIANRKYDFVLVINSETNQETWSAIRQSELPGRFLVSRENTYQEIARIFSEMPAP